MANQTQSKSRVGRIQQPARRKVERSEPEAVLGGHSRQESDGEAVRWHQLADCALA